MCSAKDRYTLIEQSSNSRITCMHNGQKFWEILERIIGKISSIIGAGLELRTCINNKDILG